MSSATYERIRNHPKFAELVERRSRYAWSLTAIIFVVFSAFLLAAAFAPDLVSIRPFSGSNMTLFILAGLFQFIVFWLLALMFVRRANGEFDDLTDEIVSGSRGEE